MAKKCARTFSIVVEKGKKSILDVGHLLPVGIARSVCGPRYVEHKLMILGQLRPGEFKGGYATTYGATVAVWRPQ
jgi:hypothetical protein